MRLADQAGKNEKLMRLWVTIQAVAGAGPNNSVPGVVGREFAYRGEREGKVLAESQIKQAGLKVTLPRMKILEILETGGEDQGARHLRAEDVYRILLSRGEVVGLATVYRVLTQFEAAGLVSRHNFEGGHALFELDRGAHHDHLVCIKCGQVVEFLDEAIEERQRAIAAEHGFTLEDHTLNIHGLCPNCQPGH